MWYAIKVATQVRVEQGDSPQQACRKAWGTDYSPLRGLPYKPGDCPAKFKTLPRTPKSLTSAQRAEIQSTTDGWEPVWQEVSVREQKKASPKPVEAPPLLGVSASCRQRGIALADKCWNSTDRSFFSLANRLAGIVDALRHGDFTADEAESLAEEMAEYYAAMVRIADLIEEGEPKNAPPIPADKLRGSWKCIHCGAGFIGSIEGRAKYLDPCLPSFKHEWEENDTRAGN